MCVKLLLFFIIYGKKDFIFLEFRSLSGSTSAILSHETLMKRSKSRDNLIKIVLGRQNSGSEVCCPGDLVKATAWYTANTGLFEKL